MNHTWTRLPRRLIQLVGVLGLCAPFFAGPSQVARATDSPAALPAAGEVIARSIEALGGREAILRYSSRHETGTFGIPAQGINGSAELFAAKPNRLLIKINIPGIGDVLTGFDGQVGWSLNPMVGPQLMEGQQLAQAREMADFYLALHEEEKYQSLETVERTEFEGTMCYKLRLVSKSGLERFEYYAVDSGLMMGMTTSAETPMGSVPVRTVVSDYKEFGGLLYATKSVQKTGGQEIVITLASVEHDTVDDSVFELPPEIKALLDD